AVIRRGTIRDFFVPACFGYANLVADARDGREVAADDHVVVRVLGFANVGQDAVLPVVAVDPFEAGPPEIGLMARRLAAVEGVEVREVALYALMRLPL